MARLLPRYPTPVASVSETTTRAMPQKPPRQFVGLVRTLWLFPLASAIIECIEAHESYIARINQRCSAIGSSIGRPSRCLTTVYWRAVFGNVVGSHKRSSVQVATKTL